MTNPQRSTKRIVILLFGSILIAGFSIEIVLPSIGPKGLKTRRNNNSYQSFIWTEHHSHFDAELGFFHEPHLNVPFENAEYSTHVRTNSWGFRDNEESLKDPEILLMGDSFAFGWGVEEDETAASILENLGEKRVLNMGVACYGTLQQFLLLQRFCEAENVTDATVVFLYYMNDRIENCPPPGEIFPTVRKEGKKLLFTPANEELYEACMQVHTPSWITQLSRHSVILDLTVGTFLNPRQKWRFNGTFEADRWKGSEQRFPGSVIGPFEVLEYLFRVLSLYSKERDLELKVVLLPFLEKFESPEVELDYSQEKSIFDMLQIPYKDLSGRFSKQDFYPIDRHLNVQGQRKLGAGILEFLKERRKEGSEGFPP